MFLYNLNAPQYGEDTNEDIATYDDEIISSVYLKLYLWMCVSEFSCLGNTNKQHPFLLHYFPTLKTWPQPICTL